MNKNTINDEELGAVSGGVAGWSGSRGNYVNCGSHIVYTVYHGEKLIEWNGVLYNVIRTDWTAQRDSINLICEERVHNG